MADQDLLQSWKEIATHLGRSERTCRRWETEFELPVHRMDGSVRGSVFAYKSELDRWMDEILHEKHPAAPPKKRFTARWLLPFILTLVVIAVVAVVFVASRGCPTKSRQSSSFTRPTLAILPFTNNTGDDSLDFWENALADLLVNDLYQSRYLMVLPQDALFAVLRDLNLMGTNYDRVADLERVAARAGVDNVVVGSFTKAGQRFRISATVRHIPSETSVVLPSVEVRSDDEIFFRVDELSTAIKNHLVSPVEMTDQDPDLDVGKITTSSVEAYRYFIDGRSSMRNGNALGAMESFEKAVEIDPEFAMAHHWLAKCFSSLPGFEDRAEESRSLAFQFSDHASPRERLFIGGEYYMYQGQRSWDRAIEMFLELLNDYPDDPMALQRLSYLYRLTEQWEKCIETLESMVFSQNPASRSVYLRRAYSALGQYEAALDVARTEAQDQPSHQYRSQLAFNLILDGKFDAALLETEKMSESSPGNDDALTLKGDIHFLRGEWDEAEACYRELLTPVGSESARLSMRIWGFRRLARLYFAQGQTGQALDFIDQAIQEVSAVDERPWNLALQYKRAVLLLALGDYSEAEESIRLVLSEAERRNHVTGRLTGLQLWAMMNIDKGNLSEAQTAADEMRTDIDGWLNPKLIRRWHSLEGHIQLAENNHAAAVAHFEQAVALLPYQYEPYGDAHAWYYDALAHAYYLSGDLGMAQEWYEKILVLTSGRLTSGGIYARSYFMLGKIHEAHGMDAEAVRCYRIFLDLWREADHQTVEVEQARRSLQALLD